MSFATVRLFRFTQGVNRESLIPVFESAAVEASEAAGNGPVYPSLSFTDVKVKRDVKNQIIQLSIDETNIIQFERCNVAVICFSQYNRWYWITGYTEITNSAYPNGIHNRVMYEITLEYIPVTTSVSLTETYVNILSERKPTATDHIMQNWTQSIMVPASTDTSLPQMPKIGTITKGGVIEEQTVNVLWCEITFVINNNIKRYGIFIPSKQVYGSSTVENVYAGANNNGSVRDLYPSLREIMNDPITYLGITGATITDVNISEFCPYMTVKDTTDNGVEQYINIESMGNTVLSPTNTYTLLSARYYAYDMTRLYLEWASHEYNPNSQPKLNKGTLTLSLTDFEKSNGQLSIKDSMRNDVRMFPRENLTSSMTMDYYVYSDFNNIYLVLDYQDTQISLPGYKIPWATSMWDTYRSFSLQFDRQALQNNIDAANREMNVSLTDAAANGIIGGAFAGAVTGGAAGAGLGVFTGASSFISSAISGGLRREEEIRKLMRDQELTEQRMKSGPSTMNNNGVNIGVINMINQFGGAEFIFRMPEGFTRAAWETQTAIWGYPANKLNETTLMSAGYWKGEVRKITGNMNNTDTGEAFDLLVQQVRSGIRIRRFNL